MYQAMRSVFALIKKDIRLFFMRGGGLGQSLLLGLLLIFVFSLSQGIGETLSAQSTAALFWLASVFCMVLIFNTLHSLEESNSAKTALHLMPSSVLCVWLAKAVCGFIFILATQCVFLPALFIFLGQSLGEHILLALSSILLIDIGMSACGALLGALAVGQTGKESLLSIVLFPLLTPLLLAGINLLSLLFSTGAGFSDTANSWLGIVIAFDGLFLASALVLFPFIYSSDE